MISDEMIARVESGTGADRELDALIWCEVNGWDLKVSNDTHLAAGVYGLARTPPYETIGLQWRRSKRWEDWIPAYTASLDAVLSLIEAKLPGITDNSAADFLAGAIDEMMVRGWRPSEPNAPQICRAALASLLRALKETTDAP